MSDDNWNSYSMFMKKASTLLKKGKLDESLECYSKALEFTSTEMIKYWILQHMATQLEYKKRYDEAIEVCNKALRLWSWDDRWKKRKEFEIIKRDEWKAKVKRGRKVIDSKRKTKPLQRKIS